MIPWWEETRGNAPVLQRKRRRLTHQIRIADMASTKAPATAASAITRVDGCTEYVGDEMGIGMLVVGSSVVGGDVVVGETWLLRISRDTE